MGTTQLVMLLSERPEYNYKISEAYFLAPAVYFSTTPFTGVNLIPSKWLEQLDETLKGQGIYEVSGDTTIFVRHELYLRPKFDREFKNYVDKVLRLVICRRNDNNRVSALNSNRGLQIFPFLANLSAILMNSSN